MKGGRKLSQWNIFVKKVYQEGKAKNSNYEFKQALVDASKRKSEMGSMKVGSVSSHKKNKSFKVSSKSKGRKSLALTGGKTRRRTRRRH
jgi:hypothetical protein